MILKNMFVCLAITLRYNWCRFAKDFAEKYLKVMMMISQQKKEENRSQTTYEYHQKQGYCNDHKHVLNHQIVTFIILLEAFVHQCLLNDQQWQWWQRSLDWFGLEIRSRKQKQHISVTCQRWWLRGVGLGCLSLGCNERQRKHLLWKH